MLKINVAFVGDTHGSIIAMYDHILALERRANEVIDAIVQVGDFGIYLPTKKDQETHIQLARFEVRTTFPKLWDGRYKVPIPTWVCPGNHEDYKVLEMLLVNRKRIPNLHILPDGKITNVLGLKIGAIWGNYSEWSYRSSARVDAARQELNHSKKALHIYQPAVEALLNAGTFDVLITHDAAKGFAPFYSGQTSDGIKNALGLGVNEPLRGGCPDFAELYKTGIPEAHFFGHFHTNSVLQRSNPRIVCLHAFDRNAPASIEVRQYEIPEGESNAQPAEAINYTTTEVYGQLAA